MAAYDKLVDLLPTLWRPQPGDATLAAQWLKSVGGAFDGASADVQHILRAHWFDTADAAAWAKHFDADRRERGLGPLRVGDARDRREALRYPYVRDLARVAALLDLPPWRDPASLREGVEEYRQRVADIVDAYREGLVTPAALRRLIDAALPEDMGAVPAAQRGRYALEEPAILRWTTRALVSTPVVQETGRVAPLARWAIDAPGAPGFVIEGVAADALGAATVGPMVERYTPQAAVKGIGIAYDGTLAPGQALRLTPARRHWLLRGNALHASVAETASNAARDPSANGPYAAAATVSAGRLVAVAGAPDGALWAIQRTQATQRVQRFHGSGFQAIETNAPAGPFNALAVAGDAAWLGTDSGLFRCPLWPTGGAPLRWDAVAGVNGAIRSITPDGDGVLAAGAQGVWPVARDGSVGAPRHAALDLVAHAVLGTQELMATASALFLARQGLVWRYDAQGPSEELADWTETAAPDGTQPSPLPEIRCIAATPDGSLWLGGPRGLARWFAGADGTTRLAAFPDVCAGAVQQLAVDERGMLWIAGDDGLFRFDGRDLAQYDFAAALWLPLGDADQAYPDALRSEPRGFWRFDRAGNAWQRFDAAARRFVAATLPARAAASEPVAGVAMRPALRAELGSWDGSVFAPSGDVPPASLRLRVKPDETRAFDGVQPFLPPTDPAGTWRYLQLADPAAPPASGRPWWSTEGQLFPPPTRSAAVPGHWRDAPAFLADAQHEGQFDHAAFTYPPSAKLWIRHAQPPAVGIRVRLFAADPAQPIDPAVAARVWQLIQRARPAGVPLQLMSEGTVLQESPS